MTDKPITDEEIEELCGWIAAGCPVLDGKDAMEFLKHDAMQAIARIEADRERIEKVVSIAGSDPGDIDGAIRMLKERQRQIGLQSQELGQLRGRVKELEAEVERLREIEKRYIPTEPYFLALCPKCKWVGTSQLCGTGDYFAQDGCECPKCGHDCEAIEQESEPTDDE